MYEGRSINKLQTQRHLVNFPNLKNVKYAFCEEFYFKRV